MSLHRKMPSRVPIDGFFAGSDARVTIDAPALLRLWRDMRQEVGREDLPLDVATKDPSRRWYEAITGQMPIAAVCYATATMLLGWWPWNFLLLLLLFSIRNRSARFYAFPATQSNGTVRPKVSYTRGSSL
jgi:hypothetical protein